jgi:hypothetical protein
VIRPALDTASVQELRMLATRPIATPIPTTQNQTRTARDSRFLASSLR